MVWAQQSQEEKLAHTLDESMGEMEEEENVAGAQQTEQLILYGGGA